MKVIRKALTLHLEFSDLGELEDALLKTIREAKAGLRYNREMSNTSICEWSIIPTEPIEYKEEYINGKFCLVFPSKMNKPIELKAKKR